METLLLNDAVVAHVDLPQGWTEYGNLLDLNPDQRVTMHAIGSLWAGQHSQSLDDLFSMMAIEPIRADFEEYGGIDDDVLYNEYGKMIWPNHPNVRRVWGNFEYISFNFSIETNDRAMVKRLKAAVKKNYQLPTYRKLPDKYRAEFDALLAEKKHLYKLDRNRRDNNRKRRIDQIYARLTELSKFRKPDVVYESNPLNPETRKLLFSR